MSKRTSIHKVLPVFFAFYVMGFVDIVGVATGYIKLELQLSDTLTQMLTMMIFVWFAILSIPVGVLQDKKGKKNTVNLGIVLTGIGMLIPFVWYSYYGMLFSFIFLGIGNTIIQVSANPLMQDVSSADKLSRNLTLSQFVKAIAGTLGPVIAAFCAVQFGNWTYIYWVYLAICIVSMVWLSSTKIEETKDAKSASISGALKLLADKKVALLVLGTFLMVGFDVGMNTNIVNYMKTQFSVSQEEASIGISVYFAALMIGRFLSAIVLNWISSNKMFVYCTILSVISFMLLFFMPSPFTGQIAIFFIGLFSASLFPLIFATGLRHLPERANEISGLMIMSVCGGAVIPPVIGILNDAFGLMIGMLLMLVCLIYVVYLSLYVHSRS
ncbi:MFS transporter [uncultured Proteiniphilum sp.]|uniref:MFS transporter n=1 Tax=uncultured Proteiniphilum sp. TaxID=497637 RepID=UPI00261C9C8E|nr:MFS transporter [uncultured Proteiniphilum sp.]